MQFKVKVKNKILGNSERVMSLDEIRNFNVCAYRCALAAKEKGTHTIGMWTVEKIEKDIV